MRERLPEPSVTVDITPFRLRVRDLMRRVIREAKSVGAFIVSTYRKQEPSVGEAMMFARAAYDAATGGQTVEREDFIWKARTKPYGERGARKTERSGTAYVQKRGPFYHDTVRA